MTAHGGKGKGPPNRKSTDGSAFDTGDPARAPRTTTSMPRAVPPAGTSKSSPAVPRAGQPGGPVSHSVSAAGLRSAQPAGPTSHSTSAAAPRPGQPADGPGSLIPGSGAAPEPGKPSPAPGQSGYQAPILASSFARQGQQRTRSTLLGATPTGETDAPRDLSRRIGVKIDGRTPAPGLSSRDAWKATDAPCQNREGDRSPDAYQLVIDQFAVGHNERYVEDGPGKPRAHIFVWDVTRAMNAEVPHFAGPKELSLGQTCDWVRHEGPMRGWLRTEAAAALEAANAGYPVLALPKDSRVKLVAVVRPGRPGTDGKPRLAAAAVARGTDLGTFEALGVFAVEYYAHP